MNVLFLGGNRFFGKKLLKKIAKKKELKIFVVNRGNRKIESNIFKKKNINFIKCDRKNTIQLQKKLKNIKFDIIFDNCAYHLSDVKSLLKVINKNNDVTYIFSSTVMSYLNLYLKKKLNEKDWFHARSTKKMLLMYKNHELIYAKNKRKIENFLIKNKKIKYIILRIHNVVGMLDFSKKTSKLFKSNYDQLKNYKINKEDFFQFTYDKDLIKILYKFFCKKTINSDVYNICNNPIKVKDFLQKKNKFFKNNLKNLGDEKFPFPRNVIMNNYKVRKKFNFNFKPMNKVINEISKSSEFK